MNPHRDALDKPPRDRFQVAADLCPELKEALGWFLSDERFQVAVGGNPNVVAAMLAKALDIYRRMAGEEPPR